MNIKDLLEKYQIKTLTKGKNVSQEWIGVNCPFCNDSGFHGGFNLQSPDWYYCWKCGNHPAKEVFSLLSKISIYEARKLLKNIDEAESKIEVVSGSKSFSLPLLCGKMRQKHREYLESRNYDAEFLEQKYKLLGTGRLGIYKDRVIAPIFVDGKMISYQGRDISGKAKERYMACQTEREIIHHKHTLYNIDNAKKDFVIVFEGITSVWRWGDDTVATFGIMWKVQQAKLLLRLKRVFIFFDSDTNARIQSQKLASFLSSFNIEAIEIDTKNNKDPADLSEKDIKHYKNILKLC